MALDIEEFLGYRFRELPDWWHQRACAGKPTEWWYPPSGRAGRRDAQRALAICTGCPAAGRCLEYALEHREPFGIWGGKTQSQREVHLRRSQARPPSMVHCVVCGGAFFPRNSVSSLCSQECRRLRTNESSRRYHAKLVRQGRARR